MTYYVIRVKITFDRFTSGHYVGVADTSFGPLPISEAAIQDARWFGSEKTAEAFMQKRFSPTFHPRFEVKRLDITLQ